MHFKPLPRRSSIGEQAKIGATLHGASVVVLGRHHCHHYHRHDDYRRHCRKYDSCRWRRS